jgi:hypothetical protein
MSALDRKQAYLDRDFQTFRIPWEVLLAIDKLDKPFERSTSTVTKGASIPVCAREKAVVRLIGNYFYYEF